MKRSAVVCHSLAMALATAAAGVVLCAGPARAEETEKLALAPLPEVLTGSALFVQKEKGGEAVQKEEGKGEEKGEGKGEEEEGKECNPREDWRRHRVRLCDLPVGYVIDRGVTFSNLIPNHPAGFPADNYSYNLTPVFGLGHGTEVTLSWITAQALGRLGSASFYGAGLQKRLIQEGGMMPEVSLGIRGNLGPDDHNTVAGYLVGTKKILGADCGKTGAYLTGGARAEAYDTDRNLASQTPRGEQIPPDDSGGVRPFVAMNVAFSTRLFASAEWSKAMPWEFDDPFCIKGTVLVYKDWGVQGGVRNVGYITHSFINVVFGSFGGYSRY